MIQTKIQILKTQAEQYRKKHTHKVRELKRMKPAKIQLNTQIKYTLNYRRW
jgi:hypothetical protein